MRGISSGEPAGVSTPAISTRRAARCASLPTGAPEPPRGAAALPPALPPLPFEAVLLPLMILAFDHFAGRLGDADLPTAFQHTEPDLGRLLGLRVDQLQIGQMDRRLTVLDAAFFPLALLGVVRCHVDAGDNRAIRVREHPDDL